MFFLWLIAYGFAMVLSRHLSPLTPWAIPIGLLASTGALVLFQPAVLRHVRRPVRWTPHLVIYLLPVAYHLLRFSFSLPSASAVATLLLAATLEELVFRGVVLDYFKRSALGILLSAVLFAAAHLLGGFDPAQLIFALAAGLALGVLAKDNLPLCIAIHFLINLTANPPSTYEPLADWLFWLCVAAYLACGIHYLIKRCSNEALH